MKTIVIAEAGVNHNGDLARALQMIAVARHCGADVVKFQTFRADQLATANAQKAGYQVANTGDAGSQLEMLRALELSRESHVTLAKECRHLGIRFMSTAFDSPSLAFLSSFDMPAIKIPSGDVTCGPLLLQAARLRRPLIVSTGMCTLADVEAALGVIAFGLTHDTDPQTTRDFAQAYRSEAGQAALQAHVTLLHCVTQYPASPDSVNLRAMATLRAAFGLPVGYSDHTAGIEISIAAVACGATIIEKHFTLDRTLPGPDHAASLEPGELGALVAAIRNVERALGRAIKAPVDVELENLKIARRSLVAARPIRKGEVLTAEMLVSKRPASGVSPMQLWDLLGRSARRDFATDEPIEP